MGNPEMPNLATGEENKSELNSTKLNFEEVEDNSSPENAEELLEQLSIEDKKQVEEITAEMPLSAKAEIMQAIAAQVKLFKELGEGLKKDYKEKIDWDKIDKKKVIALSAYAMISVMGGFAANAEAAEDDQEGETLTADFVNDIVNNAVINDLKTMDNLSNAEGQEFMDTAYKLANAMVENGVKNAQMKFDMAIEGMVDYINWAKGIQGTQVNADFSSGLQDIFEVYSTPEAETPETETDAETFTDLPQEKTLEFGDHLSAYEQSKAQEYYDYTVETIDEGADEFEGWKLKYGHKANFGEFEEAVGQWLDGLKGRLESVENYAVNPESTLKISLSGNMSAETFAEIRIDFIASQVNLRTIDEKMDDAFEEF